jgi:hypothetical protein
MQMSIEIMKLFLIGTLVTIIISSSIVKVRAFNDNDLLWSALGEDHLHNLGNAFNLYNLCLKSHPTDKTALDSAGTYTFLRGIDGAPARVIVFDVM